MVRTVERIIAQNDAVLSQYDDEYTPLSEASQETRSEDSGENESYLFQ